MTGIRALALPLIAGCAAQGPGADDTSVAALAIDTDVSEEPVDSVDSDDGSSPEEENETDVEDSDSADATGLVGGLVEFTLLQIACPSCFGAADTITVTATAAFHDPVDASWTAHLPTVGTCASDVVPSTPPTDMIDLGSWIYLSTGADVVLPLKRASGEMGLLYEGTGLGEAEYVRNASYAISVPDNDTLGPFEVEGALYTPSVIDSIEPLELLYTDGTAAFAPVVSKAGTTLKWSPGGPAEFLVLIEVYSPDGEHVLGQLLCLDYDDGALTIPSGMLSSYPSGALLAVYMNRYRVTETVIPPNGATLQAIAQFGVLGTATLVP